MERITKTQNSMNEMRLNLPETTNFEAITAVQEKELQKVEEIACRQLMKNLLKTNLRLLKLNEISAVLLF